VGSLSLKIKHNAEENPLQIGAVDPSFGSLIADHLGCCERASSAGTVVVVVLNNLHLLLELSSLPGIILIFGWDCSRFPV
jgi:hypothetical protein